MSKELESINNEIEQIDKQLEVIGNNSDTVQFVEGSGAEVPQGKIEPTTAEIVEAMKPKNEPFHARKIAICGFAETSYKLAPWGNPDWEIWGLNGLHKIITWANNITRWFQIHPKESIFGEGLGGGADHVKFLQSLKIPVYMTQHYDEIPMSVAYPLKEICEWFSIGRERERHPYLSNTISEMLALLAYEIVIGGREVDEVGVWGVDMAHSTEYCVDPETKVLTSDLRWICAKDIEEGRHLIGFDEKTNGPGGKGQNRRWKESIVEGISKIIRPCYKLTMEDGSELICSAEHQWLCQSVNENHWMTTEQLIPKGMYKDGRCSHICKPLEMWEEDNSYEAGYLAAAFDGEGHISQTPNNYNGSRINLGFSQRENGMSDAVEKILKVKNFIFNKQEGKEHESIFGGNTFKYYISGGKCEVLRFLGQMRPKRLLDKFNSDAIGAMRTTNRVGVLKKEFLGEREVIGWKTSTKTFIAEGFASHNSYQKPSCEFYLGIFEGYRQIMEVFKRSNIVSGIFNNGVFQELKLPFPSKWHLPKESLLLQWKHIYGYEEKEDDGECKRLQARRQILINNRNSYLGKEQEAHDAQMQFLGAMQEMDNEIKNRGY
jgi:hypothetical protein